MTIVAVTIATSKELLLLITVRVTRRALTRRLGYW